MDDLTTLVLSGLVVYAITSLPVVIWKMSSLSTKVQELERGTIKLEALAREIAGLRENLSEIKATLYMLVRGLHITDDNKEKN